MYTGSVRPFSIPGDRTDAPNGYDKFSHQCPGKDDVFSRYGQIYALHKMGFNFEKQKLEFPARRRLPLLEGDHFPGCR